MRDPSLHITRSDLIKILKDIGHSKGVSNVEWYADLIMKKARLYTPHSRKFVSKTKKSDNKANKIASVSIRDAELFSQILLHKRKSLKHRGISQIKAGSRDWLTVKNIVTLANEFCEVYDLDKREGYIEFINIGIERMAKFMLVKFLNMGSSIIDIYGFKKELDEDETPKQTEELYKFYRSQIVQKTGLLVDYSKPEKYVYFLRVKNEANKLGISGEEYIKAQFYALEWRNGYPDPIQLVGDKAIQYLNKYLFEKGISLKTKSSKVDWSKIKSLRDDKD